MGFRRKEQPPRVLTPAGEGAPAPSPGSHVHMQDGGTTTVYYDDRYDRHDIDDDRPTRAELADGCDGSPWCRCVDCSRLPRDEIVILPPDVDDPF